MARGTGHGIVVTAFEKVEQPLAGNAFGVARGGSWVSDPSGVRVSRRLEMLPDAEEPHIGFRCAVDRI